MKVLNASIGDIASASESLLGVAADGHDVSARLFEAAEPGIGARLVWFHGGGWVSGCAADDDWLCLAIAEMGICVCSVEYRLSPRDPYPAALLDGLSVVKMVTDRATGSGTSQIWVGGASAGGNLAAGLALLWHDLKLGSLDGQVLICPAVYGMRSRELPSGRQFAVGFGNDENMRQKYWNEYIAETNSDNTRYAAPLSCPDLSGAPDALIVTAEQDPIRDEAEEYGRRLVLLGRSVSVERFAGERHGFFDEDSLSDVNGKRILELLRAWSRARLEKG